MKSNIKNFLYRFIQNSNSGFFLRLSGFLLRAINNSSNHDFHINGEKKLITKISSQLNEDRKTVVFDVGANEGDWTSLSMDIFKNSKIHCFEIVNKTFTILKNNLDQFDSVTLNNFGLSDNDGLIQIKYYPNNNTGSSMFSLPWNQEFEMLTAQTHRGDDYCREKSIKYIDFLKIDVEGADLKVIKGFNDLLEKNSITAIQFEYGKGSTLSKDLLNDFYNYLSPLGFKIGKVMIDYIDFKEYELFKDENLMQCNFLAVSDRFPELIKSLSKND